MLNATSSTPKVSFKWELPNGDMVSGANVSIENVNAGDAGTYIVTVANEFDCDPQLDKYAA